MSNTFWQFDWSWWRLAAVGTAAVAVTAVVGSGCQSQERFSKPVCLRSADVGGVYFGGDGEPKSYWSGFSLDVSKKAISWKAYTKERNSLPGSERIAEAPATFSLVGVDQWSAIFENFSVDGEYETYGIGMHDLRIIKGDSQCVLIQDGERYLELARMSPKELKSIEIGIIPDRVLRRQEARRAAAR